MNFFSPVMKQYFMAQMEPTHHARQKALETFYLSQFLDTPEGKEWKGTNILCVDKTQEEPDFLFVSPNNTKVGLEIVDWVNQTKECRTTQILTEVAGDICHIIKKERNISLSLTIDIYDPNRWERKTRADFLEYAYHPGVKHLHGNKAKIKKQFLEVVLNTPNLTERFEEKWVDVNSQRFKLSFCCSWRNYPEFFVNNTSTCWNDPIQALQNEIDKKNQKYAAYIRNCETCSLLIVPPLYSTGNCLIEPETVSAHCFTSKFKHTYVLELRGIDGPTVSKLITSEPQ